MYLMIFERFGNFVKGRVLGCELVAVGSPVWLPCGWVDVTSGEKADPPLCRTSFLGLLAPHSFCSKSRNDVLHLLYWRIPFRCHSPCHSSKQ